jgi:hypothetical protein
VLSATQVVMIVVNEVNQPPVLSGIGNKTVAEGTLLSFTALGSDPDLPAQPLTYSLDSGAPAGALINPTTGLFTWTPTEAQGPSTNVVTIRVSDNGSPALSASETITIIVSDVNSTPSIATIGNKTVAEGNLLSFTVVGSDSDIPVQSLSFSLGGNPPAGAAIDPVSGVFSWTPTEAQGPSTNLVVIRVSDDGVPSLTATQVVSIVVSEVNSAPVLAAIEDQRAGEGALLAFRASATDADLPAQKLTYSLEAGAPAGATIPRARAPTW